jgi:hypothetical protein
MRTNIGVYFLSPKTRYSQTMNCEYVFQNEIYFIAYFYYKAIHDHFKKNTQTKEMEVQPSFYSPRNDQLIHWYINFH